MYFVLIANAIYEPNMRNNPYQFGIPINSTNRVTQFDVTINGNPLDNLVSADFRSMAYFKFHKYTGMYIILQFLLVITIKTIFVLGMLNSGLTNSISLEEYIDGGTVYIADFSTSLDSTSDYIIPSLKSGYIRLSIKFKQPLSTSYHLLAMSEFNSTLSIATTKNGRTISSNFFL